MAEIGFPNVSVIWKEVIASDISVQEPGELVVERPDRANGGPVVDVVNDPRMSCKVSFTFAVVERIASASVKLTDAPPTAIVLAQEVARKVTEVPLKAVRVHPAGAAVLDENSEPVPMRKRIS